MSAFNRWWSSQDNHDADSKEFARKVWQAAIASVAAPIPPTVSDSTAWLIEFAAGTRPLWFTGEFHNVYSRNDDDELSTAATFDFDSFKAVRYPTKQAAQIALDALSEQRPRVIAGGSCCAVTEHQWDATPMPPAPTPSQQEALDDLDGIRTDDDDNRKGQIRNFILARPDALTGWQPIENAPKDDITKILALLKSGRVVTARGSFRCIYGTEKIGGGTATIGVEFNGYVEDKGDAWMPISPTHWMPLPTRPEGEKK